MKKQQKIFRVWRKMGDRYNGFEEIEAVSPQAAVDTVFGWDFEDGVCYDYEVDLIAYRDGDVLESYGVVDA